MKNVYLFVLLLLAFSCEKANESVAINFPQLAASLGGEFFSNQLKVQITEDSEIMIMQQSISNPKIFEKAYVLQTENSDLGINRTSSKKSIVFEKAILIESGSKLFFIGVDLKENVQLIEKLKGLVDPSKLVTYLGYGFSEVKGEWAIDSDFTEKSAYNSLAKSNKNAKIFYGDILDCTSGGLGATSCSINDEIGPIGSGCSVTCSAGYYACCKKSNNTCKCVKETTGGGLN